MSGFGFIQPKKPELKSSWKRMALRLKNATASHKHSRSIVTSTEAYMFANIYILDGVPEKQIRKVLKWYCQQIRHGDVLTLNTQFIPVAISGKTFRKKYQLIYHAMIKMEGENPKKEHPRWHRFAEKLHTACNWRKGCRKKPTRISIESFKAMYKQDGVTPKEIREILKWYCSIVSNVNAEELIYLPRAVNGQDFRKKFNAIEDAYNRDKLRKRKERKAHEQAGAIMEFETDDTEMTKEEINEHMKKLGW